MAAYQYHRALFSAVVPSLSESVGFNMDHAVPHDSGSRVCCEELYYIS